MSKEMSVDREAFMKKQSECIKDGSWMDGRYFMPSDGYCYHCKADLIKAHVENGNDGSELVTGCGTCHRSYCD